MAEDDQWMLVRVSTWQAECDGKAERVRLSRCKR